MLGVETKLFKLRGCRYVFHRWAVSLRTKQLWCPHVSLGQMTPQILVKLTPGREMFAKTHLFQMWINASVRLAPVFLHVSEGRTEFSGK